MRLYLAGILLPLVLGACGSDTPTPTATAITNVTVIDAVNGVRENHAVIFDGDEITSVQSSDEDLNVATVIDGSGKYLIPGLWDFHVHLSYDDRFTSSMPELFLSYGITSVRDTGGLMHKMLPIVEEMRAPDAIAPRVFFAGPLLDGEFVVYDGDNRPEIGVQNMTPDDARATVASLKEQGVDFIKIYEMVRPEVFAAMVEAAQEHELPIDSHVPLSLRASAAGPHVDSIEHLRNIEMDCASNSAELHETRLERLKNPDGLSGIALRSSLHQLQRLPAVANYDEAQCDRTIAALAETTMVPTLRLIGMSVVPPYTRDGWDEALGRSPAAAREEWQTFPESDPLNPDVEDNRDFVEFAEWAQFLVERMNGRDVPMGAGTDTPIGYAVPGFSLHSELEMLVWAGLTPLEAIEAATFEPARWFSLEDEMGTIDVGKRADLVLLDANPLNDINNTKSISLVVSKGRPFAKDELLNLVRAAQAP